jgi:hypothetical protein
MVPLGVTFREEKNNNKAGKRLHRKGSDSDTCGKLTAILSEKVAFLESPKIE